MKLKIDIVDAFTEIQFKGNSAAVIITDDWLEEELMQSIAIENNLSETAYLRKINIDDYQIRWFSPITEIDFCGHATLAAAFVIFSENPQINNIGIFAKAVGKMNISQTDEGYIQMEFPNRKPSQITQIPEDLLNGLSLKPFEVLRNNQAYFAVYEDEKDIINLVPDNELLKRLAPFDVVVTAQSKEYDFVSRYFWPANGGDEDPVTGSIHTGLAPYWSEKLTKSKLIALQASKRSGVVACRVDGDNVYISGKAVHYLQGFIYV